MKTSELSLLNSVPLLNIKYRIGLDENITNSNLSNQKEYDEVVKTVDESKSIPKTEKELKEASESGKIKSYSESYEVTLSSGSNGEKFSKEQNYIKNKISTTYANGENANPYLNLINDFNTHDKNELHLNIHDFIYLRDIGVYPVNKLMILRRFSSAPASPDLVHSSRKVSMGKPLSTVIGWVKNDDDIFNISFNEVWKTQDKWVHYLIQEIINDQFGVDIGNIFPMPGWGQSLMFSFMSKMGWTDYGGSNLPIGDANLLRTGVTRETEGTGLATNMSLKLETTYELKYIQNIDPTTVFYSIINNLLNMGTSNIKFLFKGGSNISNLQKFVSNPNIKSLIHLVAGAINDILREVGNIISNIKSSSEFGKTINNQNKLEKEAQKRDLDEEDIKRKANAKPKYNDKNEVIGSEPVTLINGGVWSASDSTALSTAVYKYEELERKKNRNSIINNASSSTKKTSFVDRMVNMASSLANGSEIIRYISGFINSVLASTIARYEWPMKGAIAQSTGMNMTPWHLTIGNPKAPIVSMNYIKVDSVEIKLSGDIFYNDLPRYINASISISNARPLGKQEILKFFGNTFIREYTSSVKFTGNIQTVESVEKLLLDESTSVYQKSTPGIAESIKNTNNISTK